MIYIISGIASIHVQRNGEFEPFDNQMKIKITSLPPLLAIIFYGLPTLFCLGAGSQIAYFLYAEDQAKPKFDALDQEIINQLAPPRGAIEIKRSMGGGYGRYLSVEYAMNQLTAEQIGSYYVESLGSKGWRRDPLPDKQEGSWLTFSFSREPACLLLDIYPEMTGGPQFTISVWYDLWSQPFSPPKPNLTILNIVEFDEMVIVQCSPSVHSP